MRSKLSRFRTSPAAVLSVIAVFFAIGGIGYAAATIGTSDIKKGAVTKKKLHKNSVTSKKVQNGSLKKKDLGFDPTGPAGPAGPQGPAGPGQGFSRLVTGPSAVSAGGYTLVASATGGNCNGAVLIGPPDKNSFFTEFTFGPGTSGDLSGPNLLLNSTDVPAGVAVAGPDSNMWKLIVRSQDGTTAATFEWTLDSLSGCHFAGEAVPSG